MTTTVYIIAAILGAGGLASLVATLFRGLKDVRTGSRARINDLIDDMNDARKRAEDEADRHRALMRAAEVEANEWRAAAWRYCLQLMKNGIDPIPPYGQPSPADPPSRNHEEGS